MWARRDQHAAAARGAAALRQQFTAYGEPLKQVQTFKYLGRIVAYDGSDVPAARRQLKRARAVWGRLSKVIAKENVSAPVAGMFYQAVVIVVLLYGCESWVLPPSQLRALEGFHVECARRLTGMRPKRVKGKWVYPKTAEVLKKANLKPLRHYIQKRRHTVHGTVSSRSVLEECKGAARLKGSSLRTYWWDLPMEAPEEEDTGPSGLGAFFGRSTRAPGGGGNGGGPQYDFDGARRRRQAEELAEQGIFVGEFAGRAQAAQQDTPNLLVCIIC